jgi:ABC-type uncharacterized transport system fused permease/ATPase subunit
VELPLTPPTFLQQDWPAFHRVLVDFALTCAPAALVNSGLKYMQTFISLAFRRRLTEHLHQRYLSNRTYYVASTLGGMSNADQRITEGEGDVLKGGRLFAGAPLGCV